MSTEIRWDPPKGYEGTHAEAVALAMELQLMLCEGLKRCEGPFTPCPHWAQLSRYERETAVREAANYLTALQRIVGSAEPASVLADDGKVLVDRADLVAYLNRGTGDLTTEVDALNRLLAAAGLED